MAGEVWKTITKRLKQKFEELRRGPYAIKCETLYRKYLSETVGPEAVATLWKDQDIWGGFAKTPEAKNLAAEFGLNWAYVPYLDI